MGQTYVSLEEFNAFKKEMEEKFEDMTNIMISGFERMDKRFIQTDEKIENLTEIVMDGFDLFYDKLNV